MPYDGGWNNWQALVAPALAAAGVLHLRGLGRMLRFPVGLRVVDSVPFRRPITACCRWLRGGAYGRPALPGVLSGLSTGRRARGTRTHRKSFHHTDRRCAPLGHPGLSGRSIRIPVFGEHRYPVPIDDLSKPALLGCSSLSQSFLYFSLISSRANQCNRPVTERRRNPQGPSRCGRSARQTSVRKVSVLSTLAARHRGLEPWTGHQGRPA